MRNFPHHVKQYSGMGGRVGTEHALQSVPQVGGFSRQKFGVRAVVQAARNARSQPQARPSGALARVCLEKCHARGPPPWRPRRFWVTAVLSGFQGLELPFEGLLQGGPGAACGVRPCPGAVALAPHASGGLPRTALLVPCIAFRRGSALLTPGRETFDDAVRTRLWCAFRGVALATA